LPARRAFLSARLNLGLAALPDPADFAMRQE
jgi:hypothetical protein